MQKELRHIKTLDNSEIIEEKQGLVSENIHKTGYAKVV